MTPLRISDVARLLLAWVVLSVAFWRAGSGYSAAWCPVFGWLIAAYQSDFGRVAVTLGPIDGAPAFVVTAAAAAPLVARYPIMPPGTEWTAGTLQAYAHLHAVLVLAVACAWPAPTWRSRTRLLALAVPAIAASTLLDLPLALYGLLIGGVHGTLGPGEISLAAGYAEFLQRGGRLLLPLVAAATVVALGAEYRHATRP